MQVDKNYILEFLLGGKCECVICNTKTGNKFNFRINVSENNKNMFFVYANIDGKKAYAGYIKIKDNAISYIQGNKGVLSENDLPIKALLYVIRHYKTLPDSVEVLHVGKCSRCGRRLTNPESIHTGLGPACFKKVKLSVGGVA